MSYGKWYQFINAAHTEAEIKQFISSNAADLSDSFRSDYEGIGISFNGRFNPLRIAIEAGAALHVKCLLLVGPTFNMNDYTLGFQRQEILEKQFIEVMKKVNDILSEEERAALIKKDHKMTRYLKATPSKAADKTTSHAVEPIVQSLQLSTTTSHSFAASATPPQPDLSSSRPAPSSRLNVFHAAKPAAFFSAYDGPPVSVGEYNKWMRVMDEVHTEAEIKQFILANLADFNESFRNPNDTSNGRYNPLRMAIEEGRIIYIKWILLAGATFKKDSYSLGEQGQEKLERQFRNMLIQVVENSNETELATLINRHPGISEYLFVRTPPSTEMDASPWNSARRRAFS